MLCKSDSQLVVNQVKGEFEVKESLFQKYYHLVRNLISKFKSVQIEHIQCEHNVRADMLSKLATTKKKRLHHLVIYVVLKNPSVSTNECMLVTKEKTWMTPI